MYVHIKKSTWNEKPKRQKQHKRTHMLPYNFLKAIRELSHGLGKAAAFGTLAATADDGAHNEIMIVVRIGSSVATADGAVVRCAVSICCSFPITIAANPCCWQ